MLLPNRLYMGIAQLTQVVRAFMSLAAFITCALEYQMFRRASQGHYPALGAGDASDQRIALVTELQLLITLVAVVALITWMYRAYKNVHQLPRAKPTHTPRMAAWGWFIPILNLWYPCRIMQEIGHYTGQFSHPDEKALSSRWDYAVAGWWVLNIGTVIISRLAVMLNSSFGDTIEDTLVYDSILLLGHILSMGNAIATLILLRMIAPYEQQLLAESSELKPATSA